MKDSRCAESTGSRISMREEGGNTEMKPLAFLVAIVQGGDLSAISGTVC
jgi:hypothetical protein